MPKGPSIRCVSTQPSIPILLTRPILQSRDFAHRLVEAGVASQRIHIAPVIEIQPLNAHLNRQDNRTILVTSANAMCFENASSFLSGKDMICIGEKTAAAAVALGGNPIWVGPNVTAARAHLGAAPVEPILYLRGEHITYDFAQDHPEIESCTTYRQVAQELPAAIKRDLIGGTLHLLPLFSLRTAQLISDELRDFASHCVVAISESVADFCVSKNAKQIRVSKTPNGQGMIDEILNFDFMRPGESGH